MTINNSVLELIGNTPIVKAQRLDAGVCELFLKLESANPGGSIKDRIGLSMIESAERAGKIKPGDTLVEGTAGNTGIGLALVAQQKGYRLILVVPDKMSREKIFNLKAMGAEVVLTRSDVAKGHPQYYQDLAAQIARDTPGAYFINQFGNPDNPRAHEEGTGPEILAQMGGKLDAIVFGCGSSGTMTGLSRHFAKAAPNVELVLADPVGSILAQYINEGTLSTKSASWMVEGIGEDFLPSISDFTRVKKAYAISDKESFLAGRELLAKEGILGGSSTGTLLAAALKYCREQTTPKRVLVLVCDTGNKYLSKMYNDYWMLDNGFLERAALRRPARPDPAPVFAARYRRRRPGRAADHGIPAHEVVRRVATAGDGWRQDRRHRRRIRRAAARLRRRGEIPRPGFHRDGQPPADARREIADRIAVENLRSRPRRDRDGRREIPRSYHAD
jgi:cystathionine beta-synthase